MSHSGVKVVSLVVEGPDDIRFFNPLICDDVKIFESCSGKDGVFEIVSKFEKPNVIGVCDKDFAKKSTIPYVFYYDKSCLETMLICDFQTVKKTWKTANTKKPFSKRIYNDLFNKLGFLTFIRKYAFENNLNLNFRAVSISVAFNKNDGTLNNSKIFEQVVKASKGTIKENSGLYNYFKMLTSTQHNSIFPPLEEAQGHDCLALLHCAISDDHEKDDFNKTSLLALLIGAFDFTKTCLYKDLTDFSLANGFTLFELS